MAKRKKHEKQRWYQKLKSKYRLVIFNDETYEERISFRLSRLNVFVFTGTLSILLILLTTLIIAFTPLREFIPGYMDPELPKRIYALEIKADSLKRDAERKNLYIETIRNIINGEDYYDSGYVQPEPQANYDTIQLRNSQKDSAFRAAYDRQNRYNLYIYENNKDYDNLSPSNISFYTPLKGTITNTFNIAEKHYGIDIVSGKDETIKSILDGTVIISDWSIETGYVIGIQHRNNFVSIYKHNSALLKKVGASIRAGEPIAIVGETGELSTGPHLHFELWYKGAPVNPEDYIAF
ncbi:MAG: M23 family metallopeptidase [Bacteroidales bacterium]|nr:M23 family metallopeptidase [Bacteroidales bacterium]MCF8386294.1 M23 family metallopeptidase [Bacteroidales bacterium]MCF8398171.1 M23 family metallopeptidase [Bacteroidales bacterium]